MAKYNKFDNDDSNTDVSDYVNSDQDDSNNSDDSDDSDSELDNNEDIKYAKNKNIIDNINDILELTEKDKITGEIYKIINVTNNKCYVGQTVSHRMNKGKYRPFGYIGRFNDHISEAICNTKKKQCTYLNNSIRKNGKNNFEVVLLERCSVIDLNNREQHYINECSTLYPKGYNLTKGGKTTEHVKITNNEELNISKKRGRGFGYVHKESTRLKMSERIKKLKSTDAAKNITKITMMKYYDDKKIQTLQIYKFTENIEDYIKPIINRTTGEIHNYQIKIDNRSFKADSKNESLDTKYNRLKNILIEVKNIQNAKQSKKQSQKQSQKQTNKQTKKQIKKSKGKNC